MVLALALVLELELALALVLLAQHTPSDKLLWHPPMILLTDETRQGKTRQERTDR